MMDQTALHGANTGKNGGRRLDVGYSFEGTESVRTRSPAAVVRSERAAVVETGVVDT
jgi:hypothetical protein